MNSIKILVNSLEDLFPNRSEYLAERMEEKNEETIEVDDPVNEEPKKNHLLHELKDLSWMVLSALFFIPNNMIIRPLLFLWLMIAYPFTHLFAKQTYNEDISVDNGPFTELDINEKTELLKQENIIANTIKSPSDSSKYIIPPPPRLYPLSRNPAKKKKKTLILDLDETLIHSLSRASPRSFGSSSAAQRIEVKLNKISTLYYVYKRPYCDDFLKEVSRHFELQVFTASVKEYADPIINWLEDSIQDRNTSGLQKIFTKRYYRHDCTYREGVGYIKDLSKFFPREDELKNVIILDNSPTSYALHEDNAVMIEGWINDQGDKELLSLLPMLQSLALSIDVRFILGLRSGEKIFEL